MLSKSHKSLSSSFFIRLAILSLLASLILSKFSLLASKSNRFKMLIIWYNAIFVVGWIVFHIPIIFFKLISSLSQCLWRSCIGKAIFTRFIFELPETLLSFLYKFIEIFDSSDPLMVPFLSLDQEGLCKHIQWKCKEKHY